MSKKKKSNLREWLEAIIWAVVIVLIIKNFIFYPYAVTGTSMTSTLLSGDFILVSNLHYGPRLPPTPLSLPFSHQTMPFSNSTPSYLDFFQIPHYRLPGFSEIERNDVVVFNYPLDNHPTDHKTQFIKRCMALPGDTIEIKSKEIFINKKALKQSQTLQFNYSIETDGTDFDWEILNEMHITEGGRISTENHWQLTMTSHNADSLKKLDFVKKITEITDETGHHNDYIFPYHELFPWSLDNFGPIIIPKKGQSIPLTYKNLLLYEKIIVEYEHNTIEMTDSATLINGQPADSYTFELDYYFMLGDNRHNSGDSRMWGFVPESHIIGKATTVLFSMDKSSDNFFEKIRWGRILKGI
ncbi:MAG: S26 family signal peptidase [Bacteroidetes bacterium]|nr:MAG: S26 family signal peptidase [Bacteroidota bacterium]